MDTSRERIYGLLDEIQHLIRSNENEDGTFRFDSVRAVTALEFIKYELEKSIEAQT